MQIVIDNIEKFKIFFDVVYEDAPDIIELQFHADKLVSRVLTKDHTRFFNVEYELDFFENYAVDTVCGISVYSQDIYNLLKLANKKDVLIIDFDESNMMCKLISETGNRRVFEFGLPDNDLGHVPQLPSIDADCVLELNTFDIKQSVKDIALIGTHIFKFVINENSVTYMSDTTLSTDVYSSTKYAQEIETVTGVSDGFYVNFNLEYVKEMLKFEKISNVIKLRLSPKVLIYKFQDDVSGVAVKGMIAPRVEEV